MQAGNPHGTTPFFRGGGTVRHAAVAAVIALACLWWYLPYPFSTLIGDDLYNFDHMRQGEMLSNLHQVLFESWLDKYRPFFFVAFWAEFEAFGNHVQGYIYINTVIEVLNALLLYRTAWRISGARVALALGLSFTFVTSHFALYQVWQTTGIVEGLATTFYLATILCVIEAADAKSDRFIYLAAGAWLCAVFTHERYLVFGPALVLTLVVLSLRGRSRRAGYVAGAAIVLGMLANVGLKTFLFKARFMTGTGGQRLTLSPISILHFVKSALANTLGIEAGPAYLSGEAFHDASTVMRVLMLAVAVIVIMLLGVFLARQSWRNPSRFLTNLALAVVWFGTALVSASLTFRQEFRWILAPEILLLLGVAYVAANVVEWRAGSILAALFVILNVPLAMHQRRDDLAHVFFLTGPLLAENTKDLLAHLGHGVSAVSVYTREPGATCDWIFGHGAWFADYAGISESRFRCVTSIDEVADLSAEGSSTLDLGVFPGGRVMNIGANLVARSRGTSGLSKYLDLYDEAERDGLVSPATVVAAPGGRGAFLADWMTDAGPERSIVVINGFSIETAQTLIRPLTDLRFDASPLHGSNTASIGCVDLLDEKGARHTVWRMAMGAPLNGIVHPVIARVNLDGFAGQKVRFLFRVTTDESDSSGHWVMFGSPGLWSRL